ncbi:MAG TPA: TetR/AcrR family transcriptional regulator [Candidatus Dormibacteraeota bacterium]|nr:TetR/AcrR family transcriptional regulator [Candidatus Dormibacteraeota bacterium]
MSDKGQGRSAGRPNLTARNGGCSPGRRIRLSREARRDQILRSAAAVFGRLGYEDARMEDVAKEAGIAKGLLYKHFPSKDSLFRALVDRQGSVYAAELRTALSGGELVGDPAGALRAGLEFWLQRVRDQEASFNLTDPGVHDAYEGLRESLRQVIADAVRTVAPGSPEPYPRLVAALVQGSAESLGLVWRDLREPMDQGEALELLSEFCWGGLSRLYESGRYLRSVSGRG